MKAEITRNGITYRLDEEGDLDEVIAKNCSIHIERMNGNQWFIGIDTNRERVIGGFGAVSANARAFLRLDAESGRGLQFYVKGKRAK